MQSRLATLYNKNPLRVLGLMSGTSLDGLDICLASIDLSHTNLQVQLEVFRSYPYPPAFKAFLVQTMTANSAQICQANFVIARHWCALIQQFLDENKLDSGAIDLVGTHGQTIWHIHGDSTLQIGEASVLAEALGVPVVSDFRVRDVAAGGSGAPLVPYIDYLLFKNLGRNVMLLNIGGIANFTLVPAEAQSVAQIYALDTGPGNVLINAVVELISDGKESYDRNGALAREGQIRPDILDNLMQHPYLRAPLPKSTGREEFSTDFLNKLIRNFRLNHADLPDLIATLTRFTAEAIHFNYQQFFREIPLAEMVLSGGGANNPVIRKHLRQLFPKVKITKIDAYGIPGDTKEALAFAIFAALAIREQPSNIPNVTGAAHQVVLGKISL
jgi:anhydro-N-acetylmuramic acid kinase